MRKINLSDFQIATSETARDINRRIVLNLIRTKQPISRADLARHTGLQRSTVSLIIEQLIDEQWITEGALGHLPRGRKPRFLHLNNERAGIIGINIRPQVTTLALTDLNANFLTQDSLPTPSNPQLFLEQLGEKVQNLRKSHSAIFCEGIGVGVPGRVNRETHKMVFAPNLGWRNVDFKGFLEKVTGLPVEVENAANSCALYELWFGRHSEGVHDLIALTVSEGVGTGIIANGQLVSGLDGMAGEFGHVSINEDGPLCRCGNRGCWETYASNAATINYYTSSSAKANGSAPPEPGGPSFEDIMRLCDQGDKKAVEAIDRMAYYLGVGIASLITSFAPGLIICVGEVSRMWDRVGPVVNSVVAERSPLGGGTRIIALDEFAYPRLRGAVSLVLQKHFVAPSVA
jgi:predicted NBD/HSP70 family sugar kinase